MEKVQVAIALRKSGQTVKEIAQALKVHPRTVRKWFAANPALMVDEEEIGDVPTGILEIIESMEKSTAIEVAALKAKIEKGQHGNSTVIWRMTKSLQVLTALRASIPQEDHSGGWEAGEEERIRKELYGRLSGLVQQRREEKKAKKAAKKAAKTGLPLPSPRANIDKVPIWEKGDHRTYGPWPDWVRCEADVDKWIAEKSGNKVLMERTGLLKL